MEIAIAVAAALAIIFGISITVASHYHKNSLIVWFTYLTIMFALLGPFLYWQKREWAKTELFIGPVNPGPAVELSSTPSPSPLPSAKTPKSTPTPTPKHTGGSGAPPAAIQKSIFDGIYDYEQLRYTDYVEDYFAGAIWRWEYRPEMGDKVPRNIHGFCPEDGFVLRESKGPGLTGGFHPGLHLVAKITVINPSI